MDGVPPGSATVYQDVPENDDDAERRERQRIRMLELQQRHLSSPSTPGDRRRSGISIAGLTAAQLSEHYSKCIKLSAENKINLKNAFNLHLIDCMADMLMQKDSDMNNFQVASFTLDASTKIYAYRVDSVHNETLKMAGGLGKSTLEKEKKEEDAEAGDPDEKEAEVEKSKKKRKRHTVEQNLKNLNMNKFDMEFEVYPLFKKTCSQFDEGRSGGAHFMTNLLVKNDGCELMLDSDMLLNDFDTKEVEENKGNMHFHPISPLSNGLVCPTFVTFSFMDWSLEGEKWNMLQTEDKEKACAEHAFDSDAVADGAVEDMEIDPDRGTDYMNMDDLLNGDCDAVGDGSAPVLEAVDLRKHLTMEPLEYSYFDLNKLISAWAGPQHWKIKPLSKDKFSAGDDKTKKRGKNEVLKHDYEDEVNFDSYFAVRKAEKKLANKTLKQWNAERTTLPEDLHYEATELTQLAVRPLVIVRRQQQAQQVDEGVSHYDYDNANDCENYCPDVEDQEEPMYDDDEHSEAAAIGQSGGDLSDALSHTTLQSGVTNTLETSFQSGMFAGNNLVMAPNKVSKIQITYARTAKKMDMKKLKATMWDVLTNNDSDKENGVATPVRKLQEKPLVFDKMSKEISFHSVYEELPSRLSTKMAENLSVPLAFIALLHLTNEKRLKLVGHEDMSDFVVLQG